MPVQANVQCSFEQRFGNETFIGVTVADDFSRTA
jgi:hypothetical protein